jgi:hypothetical protein
MGGQGSVLAFRRSLKGYARGGPVDFNVNTALPDPRWLAGEGTAFRDRNADAFAKKVAAQMAASGAGAGGENIQAGRVSVQGKLLDTDTFARINRALGSAWSLTQGSWSTSVAASFGTHAGSGVADISPKSMGWVAAQNLLRSVGGLDAWFRNWTNNQHIHLVNPHVAGLSPQAQAQVADFNRGGDGLGMAKGGPVLFDKGGWLQPGLTMALNKTGRPERVVGPGEGGIHCPRPRRRLGRHRARPGPDDARRAGADGTPRRPDALLRLMPILFPPTVSVFRWTVELDANPDTTGLFVIGSSLLGGTDTVAPDERWIPVPTLRVLSVSVRRGGSSSNRKYDAGEAVVVLDNTSGDYDPDNPYSPFVMGPRRLLGQGTGLRLSAAGTDPVTVFVGRIEEPAISGHWTHPTVTFRATDLMAELGNIDVPFQGSQTGGGSSSSVRAAWLLDQAGVPESKRDIAAAGRSVLATTGGGKVRDALDTVAAGEAGRFFVDRTGVVTLTWHDAEYGKTSKADYSNTGDGPKYVSLESSPGTVGIVNTATVHRLPPRVRDEVTGQFEEGPDLDDAGAADSDSVALYGIRPTTVDVVLESDLDVAALATYLATRRSVPTQRLLSFESVPLEAMTVPQAQAVLAIDLGDLITLTQHTIDGRQITWVANVESIAWDHDSPMTRVTFGTSPSDSATLYGSAGWFIVGSSLLGGVDVLAPY